MASIYFEYLEEGVQSPSKFREILSDLDASSSVELDSWYEERNSGEKGSDLESVLQILNAIENNWWRTGEAEIKESEDRYHIELPVVYERIEGRKAGEISEYVLGATIYPEDGAEAEVPERQEMERAVH
jgi:hypothetical protein